MSFSDPSPTTSPGHIWLVGSTARDRAEALAGLALSPMLTTVVDGHRHHRGAYTAAGTLLRSIAADLFSRHRELAAGHEVELLSVAPELEPEMPGALHTLTSLAVPDERTRFYSSTRTLRIAHGFVELLRDYLAVAGLGPRSVVFDNIHQADYTDQEFLAVLVRRIDPRQLTVVVASDIDLALHALDEPGSDYRPIAGGLPRALERFTRRVTAEPVTEPARIEADAAQAYVDSDCTDDRPDVLAAYQSLTEEHRRRLHDARADALEATGEPSLRLGAVPLHRRLGSDPVGAGAPAMLDALDVSMRLGFYDATLELCERGRALWPAAENFDLWWRFTTKMPTCLGGIGLSDRARDICDEARMETDDPVIHMQLAYATSIYYTRQLDPALRDHRQALSWINIAVALARGVADPALRALAVVFNQNGRALIEAHRGRPQAALDLVTRGIATLDAELAPDAHLLHRSVLRYNRAQVLAAMGRLDEAVADYRMVLQVDPHYPEYHFELANLLHRLGHDDEALAAFAEAARLGPPFLEVEYNRADVLSAMGRLDEALTAFGYVLELDPEYVDAYVNRAGILADLGDFERAAEDVRQGLALAPENPHLLTLQGRLELEAGRHDTARAALDAALELAPTLAGAWALRGAVNFEVGELDAALGDLDRAADLEPDATVLFNRASVARALGRWAEAEQDCSAVVELAPDEADGWLLRAECRRQLGDDVGAASDTARVRELAADRVEAAGTTELVPADA